MVIFVLFNSVFGLKMETVDRFFQSSNQSFFLFGPGGTGKSTRVKRRVCAIPSSLLDQSPIYRFSTLY